MIRLQITVPAYAIQYGRKALRAALKAAARMVQQRARTLIQGKGKVSQPGQAPASKTGLLRRSLRVRMGKGATVQVIDTASSGPSIYYARFLESGATGGGRSSQRIAALATRAMRRQAAKRVLLPRPFLTTALESLQGAIQRDIAQAVQNDLRGVGR